MARPHGVWIVDFNIDRHLCNSNVYGQIPSEHIPLPVWYKEYDEAARLVTTNGIFIVDFPQAHNDRDTISRISDRYLRNLRILCLPDPAAGAQACTYVFPSGTVAFQADLVYTGNQMFRGNIWVVRTRPAALLPTGWTFADPRLGQRQA